MKQVYYEAFSEVDEVLKLMPITLLNKIPNKFKEVIHTQKSKDYIPQIGKPLENCKLKEETIVILGLIYRDFLCSDTEKQILKIRDTEALKEFEAELREKYNNNPIPCSFKQMCKS